MPGIDLWVDEDVRYGAIDALQVLKIIYTAYQYNPRPIDIQLYANSSSGDNRHELLSAYSDYLFQTSNIDLIDTYDYESIVGNGHEDIPRTMQPIIAYLTDLFDYYRDTTHVEAMLIKHPSIMAVVKCLIDNKVNICNTNSTLFHYSNDMMDAIDSYTGYDTDYLEFFMPLNEDFLTSCGVLLLYSGGERFTAEALKAYYELLDYCKLFLSDIPKYLNIEIERCGLVA